MDITVKDVMQMEALHSAKILAGSHKIDNIVKGITIIELPDIVDWLSGGEILLTTLYNFKNDVSSPREYIGKMVNKEVSALIIKTGRVFQEIPSEIIAAGDEFGLPIIELSKETKYIDIMYPVMAELFNDQVNKLQYYKQVQDKFTELVLAGEGIEGIIRVLEELIQNPVVIYDRKFEAIASTDPSVINFGKVDGDCPRENLNEKFYYYRQKVTLSDLDNQKVTQVVVPIHQFNQIKAYLVVVEKIERLHELKYIILANAATVISLEMIKRFAIGEVEKKFKYDLLDSLVSGNFNWETVRERAALMGWDLHGAHRVVMMEFSNASELFKDKIILNNFISEFGTTIDNVIHEHTPHFLRIRSESLYFFWPNDGKSETKIIEEIKEASHKIESAFQKKYKNMRIFTGVGSVVSNIQEISISYQEALNAINFGKMMEQRFINYSELGIMRLLCKFGEENDLSEYIPQSVNKLLKYDGDNNANLLHTLEVFLKTNSNATQTAKELFVHYKTVLYRLEKIRDVSGIDLDNNKDRLEAELGLKIVSLLKIQKKSL